MSPVRAVIHRLLSQPWWGAVVVLAGLLTFGDALLVRIDTSLLDLVRQHLVRPFQPAPPARSIIVALDERSLQEAGHWPWRRSLQADLVKAITHAGARVIAYDLPVTDLSAPQTAADDHLLATALREHGRVVLPVASPRRSGPDVPDFITPLPALAAVTTQGHVDTELDHDGMHRRVFLRTGQGARPWDLLELALWRAAVPVIGPGRAAGAEPGPDRGPAWHEGERLLPATPAEVPVVSAIDVLRRRPLDSPLAGRVVWVGLTAAGLGQPVPSPDDPRMQHGSAVQRHARTYEALVHDRLVRVATPRTVLLLSLLPLLALAVLGTVRGRPPSRHWLPVLTLLPIGVSAVLLLTARIWLPPAAAVLGGLAATLLWHVRELRAARLALQQTQGQANTTLCAITDAVITIDTRHEVQYLNPSAERLVGRLLASARGQTVERLLQLQPGDAPALLDALGRCIGQHRVVELGQPLRLHCGEHGERLVRLIASPVSGQRTGARERPGPLVRDGAVLALTDVTDSLRAAERLHHEATHDHLTGLPNRALLHQHLQQALDRRHGAASTVAVLFMDLDRFKRINDSLGHHQGDEVLQIVAQRLRSRCGPRDMIARWGGDEFVIVLQGMAGREAVAGLAMALIEAVAQVIELDGVEVECGCSIGLSMTPEDGQDVDTLLGSADTAMYRCKAKGGRRFEFHASGMHAWTREWLTLESRLRHGLEEESFVLHYQPQIDLDSGRVVGLEALLRWRQPDGSVWGPSRFLGVTEACGLILPVGRWVIQQACRQLAWWRENGVPLAPVSVNVSARQCLDRSLVHDIAQALQGLDLPASLLKIEVTESTATSDLGQLKALLTELRAMGVGVSLDDFGTGYSSLTHLKRFPIDQIKIDPSFVRDILHDPSGAAIVQAMIALAHGLGVPVVAEGVESEQQIAFLRQQRCDIAQGYHYARPLPAREATRFLLQHQHSPSTVYRGAAQTQPGDLDEPMAHWRSRAA
ncbi:diguanylate cyclase (GGDEF)-like protein [Sphaerotilus hippei]|uniref:Diguanylate cyclase (GGDEF)-like protein n=1 Tax=Sphaerotilus hippei TaxID=744406 RepID=A0A318GX00_9BURK|nr:EAL domain-containing protein [Sphaerotilus hippei]PXW93662.1 diguanylate cyclase (GGDEF)-like protein [Sphaerotilus hippei]